MLFCYESHAQDARCNAYEEICPTVTKYYGTGGGNVPMVEEEMSVRRLTPTECERLQGFPDGYTDITWKNKPAPDGARYKALGNSMAVPCMRWIGERIRMHKMLTIDDRRKRWMMDAIEAGCPKLTAEDMSKGKFYDELLEAFNELVDAMEAKEDDLR